MYSKANWASPERLRILQQAKLFYLSFSSPSSIPPSLLCWGTLPTPRCSAQQHGCQCLYIHSLPLLVSWNPLPTSFLIWICSLLSSISFLYCSGFAWSFNGFCTGWEYAVLLCSSTASVSVWELEPGFQQCKHRSSHWILGNSTLITFHLSSLLPFSFISNVYTTGLL